MGDLIIDTATSPQATILTLHGAGDLPGTGTLEQRLTAVCEPHPQFVVLEMSDMELITSMCLGMLVRFHHSLASHGGRLLLAAPSEMVRTALRRARLDELFGVYGTLDEALQCTAADAPNR